MAVGDKGPWRWGDQPNGAWPMERERDRGPVGDDTPGTTFWGRVYPPLVWARLMGDAGLGFIISRGDPTCRICRGTWTGVETLLLLGAGKEAREGSCVGDMMTRLGGDEALTLVAVEQ